jgi:PIN domain nuclease of toxin-antitoxin system
MILDASALLALIHGESGCDVVASAMDHGAVMSAVNVAEVVSVLARALPDDEAAQIVDGFDLVVLAFDRGQGLVAGRLSRLETSVPLSLGDRACLAAAFVSNLPVLTSDRTWLEQPVANLVEVVSIR